MMRYLLFSVLVVCVIGVMIPSVFAVENSSSYGTIKIEKYQYSIEPGETLYVKVFGSVTNSGSGGWVYFEVHIPDDDIYKITKTFTKVKATDDGYYENFLPVYYDELGRYDVYVTYNDNRVGNITFQVVEKSTSIAVATDKTYYQVGDTIFIGGQVKDPINIQNVKLYVTAPNGDYIWYDEFVLPTSEKFSTSVSTDGPLWTQSGKYTITAFYPTNVSDSKTFYVNEFGNTSPEQELVLPDSSRSYPIAMKTYTGDGFSIDYPGGYMAIKYDENVSASHFL